MRLVPYRRNDLEESFGSMFNMMDEFFNTNRTQLEGKRGFRLDVVENEEGYLVEGELPGIERENIKIDYDNNLLKISVEQKETVEEDRKYIHRERRMFSMERILRFKDIDPEKIEAKLENGILKVVLPKQEKLDKSKHIEIQ